MDEAPVLIAGGGMVGLSAATFLAQYGIRSVVIERLTAISPLPRAAFFHMRTLEMFRALGIEAQVREESEKEFVPDVMDSTAPAVLRWTVAAAALYYCARVAAEARARVAARID